MNARALGLAAIFALSACVNNSEEASAEAEAFSPVDATDRANQPSPLWGKMTEREFENEAGSRRYFLYVPESGSEDKPLLIWLHGCGGPGTMEKGQGLAALAQELDFVVAYPIQESSHNANSCWNWFLAEHYQRGQGEPAILAGITQALADELATNNDRTYMGGYSAGGAMTTVMGATYPDLYAAIAPSAGSPYAFDPTGINAYNAMAENARIMPTFILQGVLDEISIYPIGRTVLSQWLGTNDYVDDGEANRSVSYVPSGTSTEVVTTDLPSPLLIEDYHAGSCHLARFLTSPYDHFINGLFFYEQSGIALQRLMMDFLFQHQRGVASNC